VVGTANQPHLARQLIEFLLSQEKQTIFCGKCRLLCFVFYEIKIEKNLYPNQVVGTANQPHLARQLIEFLLSQEEQAIFEGKCCLLFLFFTR
jgi:ABC-type thiamine transport system substrate-binding protein